MLQERPRYAPHGLFALPVLLALLFAAGGGFIGGVVEHSAVLVAGSMFFGVVVLIMLSGFFMVNPNEAKVLQLFGSFTGTVKDAGLRWANPFLKKHRVSLRIRNFESEQLKVNDLAGNPIEIAAIVNWNVSDTAKAVFGVDDFEEFVRVQSEGALRLLASHYPYEAHGEGEIALRSNTGEIAERLQREIQNRVSEAGVEILRAQISHLAYAPEIAQAMLRRQQAQAIVAARQKIVEGAVGMVQMALHNLSRDKVVELDEERKATMVSNLLVVLCGDHNVQPVVNTGTLHR